MALRKFRRTLLFISFWAFPFTFMYCSPVQAVMGVKQGVIAAGLVVWTLVFLTSLVFGRAFCSYLCPLGGLQRCLHANLRKPLVRAENLSIVKYLLWAVWVGSIVMLVIQQEGVLKIDLAYHISGYPMHGREAIYAFIGFSGFTALMALIFGERGFCHHFCFFSPLNIIGTRIGTWMRLPALRVQIAHLGRCKRCGHCSHECPMGLSVSQMVLRQSLDHPECITCGNCSTACKRGVIRYGFARPQRPFENAKARHHAEQFPATTHADNRAYIKEQG